MEKCYLNTDLYTFMHTEQSAAKALTRLEPQGVVAPKRLGNFQEISTPAPF